MKFYKFAEKIKIKKETERAVFVESAKLSEEDYKTVEDIWHLGVSVYIKKDGFWLPKTQVEVVENYVTGITLWLYNKLSNTYWDFPAILEIEKLKGDVEK